MAFFTRKQKIQQPAVPVKKDSSVTVIPEENYETYTDGEQKSVPTYEPQVKEADIPTDENTPEETEEIEEEHELTDEESIALLKEELAEKEAALEADKQRKKELEITVNASKNKAKEQPKPVYRTEETNQQENLTDRPMMLSESINVFSEIEERFAKINDRLQKLEASQFRNSN